VKDFEPLGSAAGLSQARLNLGTVTDKNDAQFGVRCHSLDRARHDWSGRKIPAHRVQRNLHGSFLLFHLHHFAALIVAAIRTDAMRQHRLVATAAVLNLKGLHVQVAPPFALPGVRGSSLGDCHEISLPQNLWLKHVIVGAAPEGVK
jgi:hypothetical protein